jgi:hypothetical protein
MGLIQWLNILRLKRAAGFDEGNLPDHVLSLMQQYGLEELLAIARASGVSARTVFQYGIPLVKDKIRGRADLQSYGDALVAIARASGDDVKEVLENSLPPITEIIKSPAEFKAYGEVSLALYNRAKSVCNYPWWVFTYGLASVKDRIKSLGDLQAFGDILVSIGHATGCSPDVFQFGVSSVKQYVKTPAELDAYGRALAEVSRNSGEQRKWVFEYGIPAVTDNLRNPSMVTEFGKALVQIAESSRHRAVFVFKLGLPGAQNHIRNLNDLRAWAELLDQIAKTAVYPDQAQFLDSKIGQQTIKDMIGRFGFDPLKAIGSTELLAFFRYGTYEGRDFISKHGIAPFAAICQAGASGNGIYSIFNHGLPQVTDLMSKYGPMYFVEIAQASKEMTMNAYYGLSLLKDLIAKFGMEPFASIARSAGKLSGSLLNALPAFVDKINNVSELTLLSNTLVSAALARGEDTVDAVVPLLSDFIRKSESGIASLQHREQTLSVLKIKN